MRLWNRAAARSKARNPEWLTPEEERTLARRMQRQDDTEARNELVERHLPLVRRLARQYARRGAAFDELLQEGCLGMLRAAEDFDPERGVRFSSYAAHWARAFMQRHLSRTLGARYAAPAYVAYPTRGAEVRARAQDLRPVLSLDESPGADSSTPLGVRLRDETQTPEEQVVQRDARMAALVALRRVVREMKDPRAGEVVRRRLLANEPDTLTAVGEQIGLSREGVRLIEKRIIGRVREALPRAA